FSYRCCLSGGGPRNQGVSSKGGAKSMNLKEAQHLKASILASYYEDVIGRRSGLRTESEPPIVRTERRIAVGLGKIGDAYRIEIRIQREGGAAQRLTERLQHEHGAGIHVEVLQKLEIPPLSSIKRFFNLQDGRPKEPPRAATRLRPLEIG